jgi:putative ABC transport system ATP-binding protein
LPSQLSGGQRQNVTFIHYQALCANPLILLADEPTGNLDSMNGESVMGLLNDPHMQGATICKVIHDPRHAELTSHGIHLFNGRIIEDANACCREPTPTMEAAK